MIRYYIIKHSGLYWGPDSRGYVDKISLAGTYPQKEALKIASNRREPPDIAVPLDWLQLKSIQEEIKEAEKIIKMGNAKLDYLDKSR